MAEALNTFNVGDRVQVLSDYSGDAFGKIVAFATIDDELTYTIKVDKWDGQLVDYNMTLSTTEKYMVHEK